MNLIKIGTIINTKGINGAMSVIGLADIFLPLGSLVFIGYSENFTEKFFLSADFVGNINKSILHLEGINTKETAIKFKEKGVFCDKSEILKHNIGYIFRDEILDCDVFDIDKNCIIGKIIDIWEMPANNVWIVRTNSGDIPLPVINDVIMECNLENKIIRIKMLDGLDKLIIK